MTHSIEWLTEQLKETKARFRTLMEAVPVALLIVGDDGLIEGANPHALKLFKCDYQDLLNQPITKLLLQCPTTREMIDPEETTAIRINGERFPVDILMRPFEVNASGKALISIEDVTKRHELEQLKRQFVSMVSHDLRDPLTALEIFLSMTSEGAYDGDLQTLKKRAASTVEEVGRLITMINSLLSIEKVESGRLQLLLDRTSCNRICEAAMTAVTPLSERAGVKLHLCQVDEEIFVVADFYYAVQVLVNLLGNAIKFSPRDKSVELSVASNGSVVKISVSDEGRGIPEEFREKIFNRFEQVHVSDARVKGGRGLGLAIAKSIVAEHGGAIGVESQEGSGSTFWFTLPLSSEDKESP